MLEHGFLRVARLGGVDLRVHWTVPVGALAFGGIRFDPALWLTFFVVIVVHELGHALLVKQQGFKVLGLDLMGYGGHCRFRGAPNGVQRSWIAWGGVLGQLGSMLIALGVMALLGNPQGRWGTLIGSGFVEINLWIIAVNLLPVAPLDGALAWRLFGELKAARWTPRRALLRRLGVWVQRRRQGRAHGSEVAGSVRQREWAPERELRSSAIDAERPLDAPPAGPDMSDDPAPSPEAQRELAALFERIAEAAARAKRRP